MTDSRRQEIGYGLAAELNKDIKCRVIHKVNTGLLSFSYSHQGCYRCWQTLKLLRESQVSFEMAFEIRLHEALFQPLGSL